MSNFNALGALVQEIFIFKNKKCNYFNKEKIIKNHLTSHISATESKQLPMGRELLCLSPCKITMLWVQWLKRYLILKKKNSIPSINKIS